MHIANKTQLTRNARKIHIQLISYITTQESGARLREPGKTLVQCRSCSKKTVNQIYNYSTVLGAAIKCKPYSEITVESGTQLKTV